MDCQVGYFHLPPSLDSPAFHTLNLRMIGTRIEAPTSFVPCAALLFHLFTPGNHVTDAQAQVV
jgi:hypothetical protein